MSLAARYLAACQGDLGTDDLTALRDEIRASTAAPILVRDGLSLAAAPSARFRQVRCLSAGDLPAGCAAELLRPFPDLPDLVAVFVDPLELSYHTFEDILPLDRLLGRARPALASPLVAAAEGVYRFSLSPDASLDRLDALGLYAPPLAAGTRGGRRYIFHAAPLADWLTGQLRRGLPAALRDGFVHVNPVFRCNRFEPGDAPFETHHDSPYLSPARGHASRHTLLLYLTGGAGSPALEIGGHAIEDIPPMTGFLFDQRLPHRGQAYHDGRKVFLRSELIYAVAPDEITVSPPIGALFSRACYLTRESVVFPELAEETSRCFSLAAAARWSGDVARAPDDVVPFVHKRYRGHAFVADGRDYWFPPDAPLEESAVIALLDHFNASVGGEAFQSRCASAVVEGAADGRWVPAFLAAQPAPDAPAAHRMSPGDLLLPRERPHGGMCCPRHYGHFDPTRSKDVDAQLRHAQETARKALSGAPVWMLGAAICLDPSRFRVVGQQIHVLAEGALPTVHFAGMETCWDNHPMDYVDVDVTAEALRPLVPPILFERTSGSLHLMLDLFRSPWMIDRTALQPVPIPHIRLTPTGRWSKAAAHLEQKRRPRVPSRIHY